MKTNKGLQNRLIIAVCLLMLSGTVSIAHTQETPRSRVYLPVIMAGNSAVTSTADQPIAVPPSDLPGKPAPNPENLPPCDPALTSQPIDPSKFPPPDLNEKTSCQLPTIIIEMPGASGEVPPASPTEVHAASPTVGSYAWADHRLSCSWSSSCSTSSPGVTEMYFDASTQIPTLSSGYSWSFYHLYNRVHFSHPSYPASCTGYESISGGIAYGNIQGVLWSNHIIGEFLGASCSYYYLGTTVTSPGAITFHIFRSGSAWAIEAWLGTWSRVATITTSWSVAAEIEQAQEYWANGGDLNTIVAPVNFIHKADIAGTSNSLRPWSDFALVAPLNGRTHSLTSTVSPLKIMDLFGGDFTSMSSHNIH